jgi:thiosulfate/3-mercaptopyruvate sulfurtransferase
LQRKQRAQYETNRLPYPVLLRADLCVAHDAGRDAKAEYAACRIPGAQFWDIDGVCDTTTDLPHMLPGEKAFAAAADVLGISNDDVVVVYDGMGMFSAPRAWWTWRVFGHDRSVARELS